MSFKEHLWTFGNLWRGLRKQKKSSKHLQYKFSKVSSMHYLETRTRWWRSRDSKVSTSTCMTEVSSGLVLRWGGLVWALLFTWRRTWSGAGASSWTRRLWSTRRVSSVRMIQTTVSSSVSSAGSHKLLAATWTGCINLLLTLQQEYAAVIRIFWGTLSLKIHYVMPQRMPPTKNESLLCYCIISTLVY